MGRLLHDVADAETLKGAQKHLNGALGNRLLHIKDLGHHADAIEVRSLRRRILAIAVGPFAQDQPDELHVGLGGVEQHVAQRIVIHDHRHLHLGEERPVVEWNDRQFIRQHIARQYDIGFCRALRLHIRDQLDINRWLIRRYTLFLFRHKITPAKGSLRSGCRLRR